MFEPNTDSQEGGEELHNVTWKLVYQIYKFYFYSVKI